VAVDPLETAVEPSDRPLLGPQQLLGKAGQSDAQFVGLDEARRQARQSRVLARDRFAFRLRELRSLHESERVFGRGKLLRFVHRLSEVGLKVRWQTLGVPGARR